MANKMLNQPQLNNRFHLKILRIFGDNRAYVLDLPKLVYRASERMELQLAERSQPFAAQGPKEDP
jgi:hypothetical protein